MDRREPSGQCEATLALLSEYLSLELPPEACRDIEAHIANCAPCVEFAESLRQTVELCRQYAPEELPDPIGNQAREQLREACRRMAERRTA